MLHKPDDIVLELLKLTGSESPDQNSYSHKFAKALQLPLRQGIFYGDILQGIYQQVEADGNSTVEYPLDCIAPGEEDEFVAYSNPGAGRIPERSAEGDYIMIPTYGVANSIDWLLKLARQSKWDIVSRYLEVFRAGFVKKMNDDGFHTLLAAGVDRNILIYDSDASQGQFTKRLVSLLKSEMRRNGGGNSASLKRSMLTDIYLSPEALEDIRNWGLDQVDEITRREIYVASDDASVITRVFGVNLHDLTELGVGHEYQNYYTNQLNASLQGSDVELVVGLDLGSNDTFIQPVSLELETHYDDALIRQQRYGLFGWCEVGNAVLDNRKIMLGSF